MGITDNFRLRFPQLFKIIPSLLLALYIALLILGMQTHEMWRDELQAWSIARESKSLMDLYKNMRYEGTPALWHTSLFIISRFTRNPAAMQVLHMLIAIFSTGLVLYKSRLPLLIKFLYPFGYFTLFEYGIISRNYAFSVLFLILLALQISRTVPSKLKISVYSLLLSFTSVFGLIISASIILPNILLNTGEFKLSSLSHSVKAAFLPTTIIVVGVVLAYLISVPPKDSATNSTTRMYFSNELVMGTVSSIWNAYIPIPVQKVNFWNSNIIPHLYITFRLGGIFIIIYALIFAKNAKLLFLYIIPSVSILLFSYVKFSGTLRHWGHLYLILLMCLIAYYGSEKSTSRDGDKLLRSIATALTAVIFISQAYAGITALKLDMKYPFASGKYVAETIRNYYPNHYIVADNSVYVSDVGFYLDEPIYSVKLGKEETFVKWTAESKDVEAEQEKTVLKTRELSIQMPEKKVLAVTSYLFDDSFLDVSLVYTSGPSITTKRPISIYEIR